MSSKYQIKVGIIGGSGLNNPTIFKDSKELTIDTPYGSPSDVLIEGKISGVDCVLLARYVQFKKKNQIFQKIEELKNIDLIHKFNYYKKQT